MSISAETLQSTRLKQLSLFIKSVLDKLVALIALIIVSPVLLGVVIAIYIRMGRPLLFTQPRPGKDGRIFTCYKFRTMTNDCDENGNLLSDEERLIPFGQFLRKTSLDELPQLWNILKGDMSFIGPRPLLVQYLDLYTPFQARRHEVKPGITGLAQINGRNILTWEEKFKLDVWYVDNWSLWLDLKILFLTVLKVLQQEGIDPEGSSVVEDFQGQVEQH
jgi:lipopolysaccharide/colanic/teichoic acid biosynthesis glycosyltransferase